MKKLALLFKTALLLLLLSSSTFAKDVGGFNVPDNTKVLYLDFWASWCPPCRESFPFMAKLHNDYADKGLAVLAVNVDENKQDAQKFLSKFAPNAKFEIPYDTNGEMASKYGVKVMPTSFLIDVTTGKIIKKLTGFKKSEEEKITTMILKALKLKELK